MKKPFIIGVLVFLALLGIGYAVLLSSLAGPSVQGKKLSQWLQDITHRDMAVRESAKTAMRNQAGEFLPHLVAMMKAQDSEQRQKLMTVLNMEYQASYMQRLNAGRGFAVLGAAAAPAIPELVTLLGNEQAGLDAAGALAAIGKDAVGPLTKVLDGSDARARGMAASALGRLPAGLGEPAVESLLKLAGDKDANLQTWVASALGAINRKPEQCVPVLIGLLEGGPTSLRVAAIDALGRFKGDAKDALPKLKELSKVRDPEISGAALNAVLSIEGTAEAKPSAQ